MQVKIYTHFQVTSCGKSFAYCPHLLKTSSCSFKKADKLIFRKSRLNWESRNITFVVSSQGCKEEYVGETGSFVKEKIKVYWLHKIQPQYHKYSRRKSLPLF